MVNRAPGGENRSSMKGESKKRTDSKEESVAGIEDHHHAGERGAQGGVVFRMPKDSECTDHSRVRSLD